MRYGQARPQEQGAFDSGRYRQHHPAATQPRRRFRAPQSKTGCAEARMRQNGGTGPAQYTPQPFSGFNPGQPHGSMQMGATPGWTPMPMPYGALVRTA